MLINEFIEKLELEFEDMPKGTLQPGTDYRMIQGWSSMHALIIIAFVDIHFNLTLSGADLRATITVKDLYDLIQNKKAN